MTDTLSDITSALSTYIVAPLNAFGLGGFVFNVQLEDTANLTAEITDHYTEDNKALQDHIAVRPKRITLRGLVGEVVYQPSTSSSSVLQTVTQKLTDISAFLPALSAAATQEQQAISGLNSSAPLQTSFASLIPPAANIYSLIKNQIGVSGNSSMQEQAYQFFYACMSSGVLMGIQTPWEFLSNMAIESIVATQSEDSIFVTDFSVTYKQVRIAATQTLTAAALLNGTGGTPTPGGPTGQGPTAVQGAPITNLGSIIGAQLPDPSLPGAQGSLVSAANIANSGLSNIFHFQ